MAGQKTSATVGDDDERHAGDAHEEYDFPAHELNVHIYALFALSAPRKDWPVCLRARHRAY